MFIFKHYVNKCKIVAALLNLLNPCKFLESKKTYFTVSSFFLRHVYIILNEEYGIDSLLHNDRDAIIARLYFVQNNEEQMRTHW